MKRKIGILLCAGILGSISATSVLADPMPSKVNIIVGNPPGGALDIVARLLAHRVSEQTGTTIVVENVPGAGNAIALNKVAASPADGTMLLLGSSNDIVVDVVNRTDKVSELAPVGTMASMPYVVIGRKELQPETTDQLIDFAKKPDNDLSIATNGVGTALHLASALFVMESDAEMTHVPYKGVSHIMSDLMGGHVDLCVTVLPSVLSHIEKESVHSYGVFSTERSPFAPDLPTLNESHALQDMKPFPELWMALFAPVATPDDTLDALQFALSNAMDDPDLQEKLRAIGALPYYKTRKEVTNMMTSDRAVYERIIADANITLN